MSSTAGQIIDALGSIDEQRELFLLKFKTVERSECEELAEDFRKFDHFKKGELNEHQALQLMEYRDNVKTARELRALIANMDFDKNRKLSFVEFCCAYFSKPYEELNNFVDDEAREAALAEARAAAERVKATEEAHLKAKEEEERKARERAEILEAESKLTGVAGMRAFFFRKAEATADVTVTNEQKIKEEAARRKQIREEKEKLKRAVEEAAKQKTAEDVIRESKEAAEKTKADAEAAEAARLAEEKKIRAERKAANNAKWSATTKS